MTNFGDRKYRPDKAHHQERFLDGRSRIARRLKFVMSGLTKDLGGKDKLNTAQVILLDGIKNKVLITMQISKHLEEQAANIVGMDGEVLPVLRQTYATYSESLRRDLETLFLMKRSVRHSDYEKAVKYLQGKDV